MREAFSIPIQQVVDLVGLIPAPRATENTASFYVRCPFCDDEKWHLNIDRDKNAYRCVRCGTSGGALDLYGRLVHHERCEAGPYGNSRKLYSQLCQDLHVECESFTEKRKEYEVIDRAEDEVVHKAFSRLLSHPALALVPEHKEALLKRGLAEESIVRNEYRSMNSEVITVTKKAEAMYRSVAHIKESIPALSKYQSNLIVAGIQLALWVQEEGIELRGIPGFFQIGDVWCLKIDAKGIIIPTRNMIGQIVSYQVRRSDAAKGPRYLTVSAKGLPGGVNQNLSRVHFPLGNATITTYSPVILTEGPLKADIAQEKLPGTVFMAIQGVNNTSDLAVVASSLPAHGVSTIWNGLDMDKLTNINVMKASKAIRQLLEGYTLNVKTLFWDEQYARARRDRLSVLCRDNDIPTPFLDSTDVYTSIARMTVLLEQKGVKVRRSWRPKTKGIDDFLVGSKLRLQKTG